MEYEDERLSTYKRYIGEKKIENTQDSYVGEFTLSDGYALMQQAIAGGNLPQAFFIASDSMAVGALRALQEKNIKVPEDVAIVSFNDIEMAAYVNPPLTTVKVHTEQMGSVAVKLLLDRLAGREIPLKVTVPTELIVRESCGAKK